VNKVVNWGHWVVAAFFAAWGLGYLLSAIVGFPILFRRHPNDVTYYVVSDAFFWIVPLLCARGIFKWHSWARTLSIVLSLVFAVAMAVLLFMDFRSGVKASFYFAPTIMTAIAWSVLIWFYLPAVRAEYLRRSQSA